MINLENITKVYKNGSVETKALDGISFSVDSGEFVAIVGPSGSGKSTLMHIIGALDIPSSGKYTLNGSSVEELNEDQLAEIRNKEIGFVFQAYNLLSRNTTLKNVMLPMMYAGKSKKDRETRAIETLTAVGLLDKIKNKPNQLSGGQKQRVAIARALSMNPSILLADEPTGNLPTSQGQEIMDIFCDLNYKGHTVILITHEEHIANRAKRIITIVDGKVVKDERVNK